MKIAISYKLLLKYLACSIAVIIAFTTISGCSDSSSELISYSLSSDPGNLDPQTANNVDAIMVAGNIFEGLYRHKADGGYELGAAQSVDVSDDGLTYTFILPQNVYWKYSSSDNKKQDGTEITAKVTANDFLFALERLLSPDTNSAYAANYYFIQNARQVKDGELPVSSLGVTADNDYQLTLHLEHTNPLFEELLAAVPAMPCNQDFFYYTRGRYGLNSSMLLSNGPFYVNSWVNSGDSKYVRVRKNSKYHDASTVMTAGVNFTVRSSLDAFNLFKSKEIDTALVTFNQEQNLNVQNDRKQMFEGSTKGIVFNQQEQHFSNANIRKALALDVQRNSLRSSLHSGESIASGIIPSAVTVGTDSYRQLTDSGAAPDYNAQEASSLLQKGLAQEQSTNKQLADMNTLSVLLCDSEPEVLQSILQGWQKDLGVYLKVDVQPQSEYQKKLKAGQFDCAYITLNSNSDTPADILSQFANGSSLNYWHSNPEELPRQLSNAAQQPDVNSMAQSYYQAEQNLLDGGDFLPVVYEKEYLVYQSDISGLVFDSGSRQLYFTYAKVK